MEYRIHVVIDVVLICLEKIEDQWNHVYSMECLPWWSFSRNFSLTIYGTKTLFTCTQPDSFVSRERVWLEVFEFGIDDWRCFDDDDDDDNSCLSRISCSCDEFDIGIIDLGSVRWSLSLDLGKESGH